MSQPQQQPILHGRNRFKADVLHLQQDGANYAIKTFRAKPWWVRLLWGRFWIRRERRALQAAAGLEGLPRLAESAPADPLSLRMEWIDATPVALSPPADPWGAIRGLRRVIDGLHRAGIAHGDLHHRDVLLSRGDDRVYVVDLATSIRLGVAAGPLRRRCFARLRDQDRIALARLEARWTGGDEQAAIAGVGDLAARRYRRARRWKARWDRLRGKR